MSNEKHSLDFIENKTIYNKIFFKKYENMTLSKGEIDEFWLFMSKYLNAKSKSKTKKDRSDSLKDNLLKKFKDEIPKEWSDRDHLKSQLNELHCRNYIRYSDLEEFRGVLMMFVDFNNQRKEKKLKKLKNLQENLPIFSHQQEIIDKLQTYSVILIAGDTGNILIPLCFIL